MGKAHGIKAEEYFSEILGKCGLTWDFVDDWYDFVVNGSKVEVKSCKISVKCNHNSKKDCGCNYSLGRFDFTAEENRDQQFEENVWVCLIVRHREQCMLYGFLKAKQLKKRRYLSLHKAMELEPIDLDTWLSFIKKGEDMETTKICYWDKISRTLKGSIKAKARKLNRLKCVVPDPDNQDKWVVKPIPGYNKSTYTVKVNDGVPYDCNCQGANPPGLGPEDEQPVCSHKAAVALKIGVIDNEVSG